MGTDNPTTAEIITHDLNTCASHKKDISMNDNISQP